MVLSCASARVPITIGQLLFAGHFQFHLYCLNAQSIPLSMVDVQATLFAAFAAFNANKLIAARQKPQCD